MLSPSRLRALLRCVDLDQQSRITTSRAVACPRRFRQLTSTCGRRTIASTARRRAGADRSSDIRTDDPVSSDQMKTYHRSLFRANVSASVYSQGDAAADDHRRAMPIELRGRTTLRGHRQGMGCDHFIPDDCQNPPPAVLGGPAGAKQCRDVSSVPLPVNFGYDVTISRAPGGGRHQLRRRSPQADHARTSTTAMRRVAGVLQPRCVPDRPGLTAVLARSSTPRTGGWPSPTLPRRLHPLDRCSLALGLRNGVRGSYAPRAAACRAGERARLLDTTSVATVAACAIRAQNDRANSRQ